MGCGGSKDKKDDHKIDYNFSKCNYEAFDNFFDPLKETLESAENLREGLIDDKEEALELTHAWKVKDTAKKMETAFQVYFNSISAAYDGKAADGTKLEFKTEAPFAEFKQDPKLDSDANKVGKALNGYLKSVANGPKDITNIATKVTQAIEAGGKLKDEAKMEGLNPMQKTKAVGAFAGNMAKLTKASDKIKKLQESIPKAVEEMKTVGPNLKSYYDKADEIGAKAAQNKKKSPSEIFGEYYKDGLMSEAEQKEYLDAKNSKDKKKK